MTGTVSRTLIFTHRWAGVVLGLLMLLWCLSGLVMMYVPYPELDRAAVNQALKPLNNSRCCAFPGAEIFGDTVPVTAFRLELLNDRPVLQLDSGFGAGPLMDLRNGASLTLDAPQALQIAQQFAQSNGMDAKSPRAELIAQDQWTVYGSYDLHRPLYRIPLNDADGTVVYVSNTTGQVVQSTQRRQRFWNWLGSVPHWLYFTELRQNTLLWSRIVIWSSIAGCFLTAFGLWLGVWQLRRKANRDLTSPYRGLKWWHHVPGLLFGVFVLSWVLSGLFSMQPWGFLETESETDAALLQGDPPGWGELRRVLEQLPKAHLPSNTVSIESAFFGGHIYSLATTRNGQRVRFDAQWNPVSLSDAELSTAARVLGAKKPQLASWQLLTDEDTYYYSHGRSKVSLPVVRMIGEGPRTVRYYFDPLSGALISKIDSNARAYRWLHYGLHRLDFPLLRARPTWDFVMWLLLIGMTTVCATGAYMGVKRLARRA